MLEFIKQHPDYLLIVLLNIVVVLKVLLHIKNIDKGNNDDDNDGGILPKSPQLDLPPGVTLPIDRKEKEFV